MQKEIERKAKEGKIQRETNENRENNASLFIQKRVRGILARKYVERVRQDEMEFLGMVRPKKTIEQQRNDPIKRMEETRLERKMVQEANWKKYIDTKETLKEEIMENEGVDLMEFMLKDRREWINMKMETENGKIPDDITKFYERFNTETPLSPEEEAQKKLEEEEAASKKKKKKGEKKKKKGKGKDEDEDPTKGAAKLGTTEVTRKFEDQYKEFNDDWVTRDETDNYKQEHDIDLARREVMPVIDKQYKEEVDEIIKIELENMKLIRGQKKKKGKKKGKKKKKKKGKKKKLPQGWTLIKDLSVQEILVQLIQNNIVKKIPAEALPHFIGEFNYCHTMLDNIKETPYDPSMALIRQLVTEYVIFPLGSAMVHERIPEFVRSFLFYGPAGTGKTLVVRACVSETNSIFFDLSPINIDGKYSGTKENDKLVASVMVVAKEYQPSIIYIDEVHKVFPGKKKKGKKGKKGGKKKKASDPSNPVRIKKAMTKWRAKFMDDKTRITIIGCTSEPENGSAKEFNKFFDKSIYFPFPDYSTRRLMWKTFIERFEGRLR